MEEIDVLIVGAGISGIDVGCRLRMEYPGRDFVILEGRQSIGGTWDLFRYPGIRSDSDMFTFGFDFRPWPRPLAIAPGEAIRRYLEDTVDEYGLRERIRFGHRVTRLSWSSSQRRWTVDVRRRSDGAELQLRCRFLVTATGYYDYRQGHRPRFEGEEDFQGAIVHPQRWPEDLEVQGRRVVVIGSGATAVTLVPALAERGARVTMLQRSPTYMVSRPARDALAAAAQRALPARAAHLLARARYIALQWGAYKLSRLRPERFREVLLDRTRQALGPSVDVERHFSPTYNPWDQRLCVVPDGDFFEALRSGAARAVTDTIERFEPEGIRVRSGELLEADLIVTATGLKLQFLGGAALRVDDRDVRPDELLTYKGVMFAGVPNWVAVIGYAAASWTLKADLSARYVCRLLEYMDQHGYDTVTPERGAEDGETRPYLATLSSAGYVRRAGDQLPRQGSRAPWRNHDSYPRDFVSLRLERIDDGVLRFTAPA